MSGPPGPRVPGRRLGGDASWGRHRSLGGAVGCRTRRWRRGGRRAPGRADASEGLAGRGLHGPRPGPAVRARLRHRCRWGRRAGGRRSLDGHTARDGREGHGDQECCGGRGSMHPANSAVSAAMWRADKLSMPRTGEHPTPPDRRQRRARPGRVPGPASHRTRSPPVRPRRPDPAPSHGASPGSPAGRRRGRRMLPTRRVYARPGNAPVPVRRGHGPLGGDSREGRLHRTR